MAAPTADVGKKRTARTLEGSSTTSTRSKRSTTTTRRSEPWGRSSKSKRVPKAKRSKTFVAIATKQRGLSGSRGCADERHEALRRAVRLYEEVWKEYKTVHEVNGLFKACERAVEVVGKCYKELHDVAIAILFRLGWSRIETRRLGESSAYRVLTFHGRTVGSRRGDLDLNARLALHNRDAEGRTRIALCSVLACLCSRVEKAWLEEYDAELPVRGYFAHALVDPCSSFRVALGPGRRSRLASLLVTKDLTLAEAFSKMDHGGPVPEGHLREPVGRICRALQVGHQGDSIGSVLRTGSSRAREAARLRRDHPRRVGGLVAPGEGTGRHSGLSRRRRRPCGTCREGVPETALGGNRGLALRLLALAPRPKQTLGSFAIAFRAPHSWCSVWIRSVKKMLWLERNAFGRFDSV
eukprot:TRINITY_DN22496_c0_g1_i1.p1 TRINITY_DN22496_c0_g1~~TRINITY_DN22496_c0_g1_i1.p1  ORF type:complete len:430 (-),score=46.14 TRINITY_DN22496_c0_g1_i1:367-1596(-)